MDRNTNRMCSIVPIQIQDFKIRSFSSSSKANRQKHIHKTRKFSVLSTMPRSILSLTLLTIFHTTTGQICPDGTIERTESEKICDANTISKNNQWYGKGKNGMIRQITYEVKSCCTKLQGGDEKIAIKEWKPNSCDQVGAYFIMHTCTDTTTLKRSQFKDAQCKIPIENQNGEQIVHTCGTECLQEKTYNQYNM